EKRQAFRLFVISYSPRRIRPSADWLSGSDYWESFARGMKADLPPWRIGRKRQLADGVEDDLELGVVFVFQERSISRKRTNVRIIAMLTCTARGLRRTLESMATPCSVKA